MPKYWVGTTTSWNTSANWAASSGGAGGDGVPGALDDVIFDGGSVQNCTCDVAITAASLDVQSGYTGTLDLADLSYLHNVNGNTTLRGGGTVDLGNSTLTVAGDLRIDAQSTLVQGTSTVVMTGTDVTLRGISGKTLYGLTITGTVTVDPTSVNFAMNGPLDVQGSLTSSKQFSNSTGTVTCSGTVTGAGPFVLQTGTFQSMTGTWAPDSTYLYYTYAMNATGTFGGFFWFRNVNLTRSLIFGPGTRTFTGQVDFRAEATYNVDNSAGGSFVFQGDVNWDVPGTLNWTAGAGTITFSGGADQTITTPAGWSQDFEAIVVNKTAGNITQAGDIFTSSFTGTSTGTGEYRPATYKVTTTGDCSWAAGFALGTMDSCAWVVGGNWTANGQTLAATASWLLQVTGTAVASGTGAVAFSDASGFTEVDASAGPWTDNGNNVNWLFAAAEPDITATNPTGTSEISFTWTVNP